MRLATWRTAIRYQQDAQSCAVKSDKAQGLWRAAPCVPANPTSISDSPKRPTTCMARTHNERNAIPDRVHDGGNKGHSPHEKQEPKPRTATSPGAPLNSNVAT
jgi:hypothetical protein